MGKIVIRWATSEQARRYIRYNQIRPSWKHFVPHLGRVRTGVCLDMMTTCNWRESSRRIGFSFDLEKMPTGIPTFEIVGQRVYELTERLRWVFDRAELSRLVREAKDNVGLYSNLPDELFCVGTINSLGHRLRSIVVLETGRNLGSACRSEILSFSETHNIPVLTCTTGEFSAARLNAHC